MRFYLFGLFLILFFIFVESCQGINSHRTVYVSSSEGDDNNQGLTENAPLQTIKKALTLGDIILLKAGDVFYECADIKDGALLRYGSGSLPTLCGYRRIVGQPWESMGNNIWRLCLTDKCFSGYQDTGSANNNIINNIGCLHEYDKDMILGRRVQYKNELVEDWDFWQTEKHKRNDVKEEDFDTLYLYLHDNPNSLKLEYSVGITAIRIEDGVLDGIRIEGFGFGVSAKTNTIIRNCEIDAIGGKLFFSDYEFTSYGNGIEFWVSQDIENCIVENNVISRCYDCGITIQGDNGKQATPRNIIIRNNLIYDCCQGWEDFLRNDENVKYDNCVFENNLVLNSGNTSGFGYLESRFKYCHVLGNNFKGNKGMIIRNNTFVGGNYYCSGAYHNEYKSNVWQGNTCVIKRGDFILSNYGGTKDVIRIPMGKGEFSSLKAATDDAIARYQKLTGDETTRFIIKDEKDISKQIKKLKKKYLSK